MDIQEHNEALFNEIFDKLEYLFARVDLQDRKQKTAKIIDYLTLQVDLDEDMKYYYKNDRKVFEQIKRRYLSKKWYTSDFQTQIREVAHNIRNTRSNQKIKQNRIYKPQQKNMLLNFGLVNN